MSKYKYTPKPAPTAYEGSEVRFVVHADRVMSASMTLHYGDGSGSQVGQMRLEWDDLSAEQQDCLTTFAGLTATKVEAEGYEKDPHTRRKQEEADRKAAEKAAKDKAEADAKAAKDAEKAEADAENEPAEPEIPVVG